MSPLPCLHDSTSTRQYRPSTLRSATASLAVRLVATAALLGALTACSGSNGTDPASNAATSDTNPAATTGNETTDPSDPNTTPADPSPSLPTLTADPETGKFDYCKGQKPFTGGAADEFGAEAVADAYCTMVGLEMEQSFLEDHLRNGGDVLTPIDFSIWERYMTAETAENFQKTVTEALSSDDVTDEAKQNLWSLIFFDAAGPGSGFLFTDEPASLDRSFSPAKTEVDEVDGRKRLLLTFDVFANLNVVKEGTKDPYLIPIARRITFALIKNPVPTSDENDWLIDSWSGNFTVDAPKKRPADYFGDREVQPSG